MKSEIRESLNNNMERLYNKYRISAEFGFLPKNPPLRVSDDTGNKQRDHYLRVVEGIAENINYFTNHPDPMINVKGRVDQLPYPNWSITENLPLSHQYRLQFLLSMIMHAYFATMIDYSRVNQLVKHSESHIVPAQLAIPLWELSKITGIAPTMSYQLYSTWNYRILNSDKPFDLGNIALLNSFTHTVDEDWFVLIHQVVDYKFAKAIRPMLEAFYLTTYFDWNDFDSSEISSRLKTSSEVLRDMLLTLERMREKCSSDTYFNKIRRFYTVPRNLEFEGVEELKGKTLNILGETGGQDPWKQFTHSVLGMNFDKEQFGGISYFSDLRRNMSFDRRNLIEEIMGLKGFSIPSKLRGYVQDRLRDDDSIPAVHYNNMITGLLSWMGEHYTLADEYVKQQGETYGTVKAPFALLKQIYDKTLSFVLKIHSPA
jgi:hypothetical protein